MQTQRKIFLPIAGSLTAAAGIVVLAVLGAAATMNAQTESRQTALLNNGLAGKVQEINHQVVTQVVWDDAVQHLDNQFDPDWAKSNIGAFLSTTDGFDGAIVLDSANRAIYAMRGGADIDTITLPKSDPTAAPLIDWVRRAEARRPSGSVQNWTRLMKTPIQASAFAKADGHLQLVSATLVQPDFGHFLPRTDHAPIVVTVRNLDDALVSSLGERFMLKDLHIAGPGETGGVALSGPDREPLGRLVWTPDRPGGDLLRQGLPLLFALLVLLGLAARMLYSRAKAAAQTLVASEARATHLASHDCLTGLPNRRLLTERLNLALMQARRSKRQAAVLAIDIDRFGAGVDRIGHQIGEEWIAQVAARLQAVCRDADTLARFGAEDFAVVQAEGSAATAAALAERILAAFKTPLRLTSGPLTVNCSIGVAVAMDPSAEADEMLRQAHLSILRARELGGDQVCFFEPEMDAALRLRKMLETDLRQALIEDALEIHYQPQIDQTGAIIGLEALARWNHPTRGLIPPGIFVQVAEESGLIGLLGLFTLKRAFQDSQRWRGLKVAINMTAQQIKLPGLASDVRALMAKFEVPAANVELEIHEATLLERDDQIEQVLRDLKAQGLSVALDNFGAGPSHLTQISRYPIDKLKIDRAFVARLGVDPEADGVVAALCGLARALKLKVMAEGVETAEQRRRLLDIGCGEAQGFLFSRALAPDAMEAFIAATAKGAVMAV